MTLKGVADAINKIVDNRIDTANYKIDRKNKIKDYAAQNNIALPEDFENMKDEDATRYVANQLERKQIISTYNQHGLEFNAAEDNATLLKNLSPRYKIQNWKNDYSKAGVKWDDTWTKPEEFASNFNPKVEYKKISDDLTSVNVKVDENDTLDNLKRKYALAFKKEYDPNFAGNYGAEIDRGLTNLKNYKPDLLNRIFADDKYYDTDTAGNKQINLTKIDMTKKMEFMNKLHSFAKLANKQSADEIRTWLTKEMSGFTRKEIESIVSKDAKTHDLLEAAELYEQNENNRIDQENKKNVAQFAAAAQINQYKDNFVKTLSGIEDEADRKTKAESLVKEYNLPASTASDLLSEADTERKIIENKKSNAAREEAFKTNKITAEQYKTLENKPIDEIYAAINKNEDLEFLASEGVDSVEPVTNNITNINEKSTLQDISKELNKKYAEYDMIDQIYNNKKIEYKKANQLFDKLLTQEQRTEIKKLNKERDDKKQQINNRIIYLDRLHSNKMQEEDQRLHKQQIAEAQKERQKNAEINRAYQQVNAALSELKSTRSVDYDDNGNKIYNNNPQAKAKFEAAAKLYNQIVSDNYSKLDINAYLNDPSENIQEPENTEYKDTTSKIDALNSAIKSLKITSDNDNYNNNKNIKTVIDNLYNKKIIDKDTFDDITGDGFWNLEENNLNISQNILPKILRELQEKAEMLKPNSAPTKTNTNQQTANIQQLPPPESQKPANANANANADTSPQSKQTPAVNFNQFKRKDDKNKGKK